MWFINSGNAIITSKLNKRFILLSAFNIGIFICCEKAAEWVIEDKNCYNGILYIEIPVTKFAFTGMSFTGLAVFEILLIESIGKTFFIIFGSFRNYLYFSNHYRMLKYIIGYFVLTYVVFVLII